MPYKVVSFHTDDEHYTAHAHRLRASLEKFGIDYHIETIPFQGDWVSTCAFKAEFIYQSWKASQIPLVWLDADATVESRPHLFEDMQADFAIHRLAGWQFASGTVYFSKSDKAESLIRRWLTRCNADPFTWDQVHLQSAWAYQMAANRLDTRWLPESYLKIFDRKVKSRENSEAPVIVQWQASRGASKSVAFGRESVRHTAEGKELRRKESGWRKPKAQEPQAQNLSDLADSISDYLPLLELGCGEGINAAHFPPEQYLGWDSCPEALIKARNALPEHRFRLYDEGFRLARIKNLLINRLPLDFSALTHSTRRLIVSKAMGNNTEFHRNAREKGFIHVLDRGDWQVFQRRMLPVGWIRRFNRRNWKV